ncbi:hypothetical protein [Pelagibius sp.]|uniref:hypothetical protein n=1 Tax=Pelagibius sp. TaxID=1931238 RepID=UPI003BAFF388
MTAQDNSLRGTIEAEMGALASRLRAARQTLASGTIVDLTPIEQDVRWLCSSIDALPGGEKRQLHPRLMGLLEEINYLGENLRAGLGELAQLLGAAGERRRALSAYASQKPNKP